MLEELVESYRAHIARGESSEEASRAVADAVALNPDLLPDAWRELAAAALPIIGRSQRHAVALKPGQPWFTRPECSSWHRISLPVGNTGRRVLAGEMGEVEMRTTGRTIGRTAATLSKLSRALLRGADAAKNGKKMPDVLPQLAKDDQKVIGEYILSFRAAVA